MSIPLLARDNDLHVAIHDDHTASTSQLIHHMADIHQNVGKYDHASCAAAHQDNLEIVRLLLQRGFYSDGIQLLLPRDYSSCYHVRS